MQRQVWTKVAPSKLTATMLVVALASTATAHAQPKKPAPTAAVAKADPLEILGVVSDDVEEQADALTEALRYQARTLPGLTVGKATQTLDVMTTANKCPQSPDPTCQQDIGKQLKTSQYLWGVLKKSPADKVTIELHHYVKDKPDHFVSIAYPANLRDQNDEALRKIAKRILVELLGLKTGFVHVTGTGPMASCAVKLDGQAIGTLRDSTLLAETTPGEHTITTEGCPAFTGTALVPVSGEVVVTLIEPGAKALGGGATTKDEQKYFTGRKIVAASLIGAGIVSGVVSIVFFTRYLGNQSAPQDNGATWQISSDGSKSVGNKASDICANPGASEGFFNGTNNTVRDICSANSASKTNSAVALATGIAGGALILGGAVLWATDSKHKQSDAKATLQPKVRLQPSIGSTSGLWLSGTF